MDRREAVKSVAFLLGGALSATTIATLFDSCNEPGKNSRHLFTVEQEKLVSELSDIIIPTTAKSPGAKAANVGTFIVMMMKECYPEDAQKAFIKGLNDLESKAKKKFNKSFLEIPVKEREQLVTKLCEETISTQKKQAEKSSHVPLFFPIVRDLTMLGYFTSEIGSTQAYAYVQIPGRYDGCVDLKPGQRTWAS